MEFQVSYGKSNGIEDILGTDFGQSMFAGFMIAAILALIIIPIVFLALGKNKRNELGLNDIKTCQQITVNAKLIDKTERTGDALTSFATMSFEFEDHSRITFKLTSLDNYRSYIIGDVGMLTYAGKGFVSFERIKEQ